MDRIVKCVTPDGNIRAVALIATELVRELGSKHGLSPRGKQAFGEALMGALLLASNCKKGERMNLKVDGTGYFRQVLVDAYPEGYVRGMLSEREESEVKLHSESEDRLYGPWGEGLMQVLKTRTEPGEKPYIGTVPLVTGFLAKDLTFYWLQSEQIPSAVGLAVNVENGEVTSAGAFLVQALPNAEPEEVALIQEKIQNYPQFMKDLADRSDPMFLLSRIFDGQSLSKLDERPLESRCQCSWERVRRSLMLLGAKELTALSKQPEGVAVQCDFCRKEYKVTGAIMRDLVKEMSGPKAKSKPKAKAKGKAKPAKKKAPAKKAKPAKKPAPAKKTTKKKKKK